ncbi:MAG TPA: hypothetical protein PLO36_06115 [Methanofastidiosum sp.]|nr:hypothetical protein [Methanofastidiosum sp.]HPA49689.1 hypothetical protein [Methanofastidiosum sp.]HQK62609.1 hypothetical protein [Methanofastidiosum sp.]HQQ49379.1 hypothetical protein [Methanofastidiosum sp.]
MNKRFLIGIAVIFMIAMVSIGAVLSYRGQDTTTCPNAANCQGNGTCDGNCDGDCDQSNCTGTCPNNNTEQRQTRTCGRTCTRN